MLEEVSKVDCWGQEVYKWKQIVAGKYYKRQGHNPLSYVLCGGGHGFIYSHLVITTKFNMLVQLVKALGWTFDRTSMLNIYVLSTFWLKKLHVNVWLRGGIIYEYD
jgi:hypothetical protein